jgi:hypothetical protein
MNVCLRRRTSSKPIVKLDFAFRDTGRKGLNQSIPKMTNGLLPIHPSAIN